MSVIGSNVLAGASGQSAGAGGYEIERSLRFNGGDTPELTFTPASSGNTRTFTISFWMKRSTVGAIEMLLQTGDTYGNLFRLYFSSDRLRLHQYDAGAYQYELITTQVFRDLSAWYHIVIAIDTTNATTSERAKLYVNGVQVTTFDAANYPALNKECGWNAAIIQRIGREYTSTYGSFYNYNGYLADFHNIDGQALAATDFGETNTDNLWVPIAYAGTYGTVGYHLDFADNSSNAALGTDTSGNSNTWTVNNLSVGRAFNQSQTWSTAGTITGSAWPDGLSNYTGVFNGGSVTSAAGGNYAFAGSNTFYRYTFPSSGLTVNSYVKVYYWKNGGTLTVNAGESNQQSITASTQVYTSTTYNSSTIGVLKNVQVETSVNTGPYLIAIEVDGLLLVDAGISDPLAYNIDSLLDSPTNGTQVDTGAGGEVVGNYATLNSIDKGSNVVLSNGNLEYTKSTTTWSDSGVRGTFGISSGKWYWEVTKNSTTSYSMYGVAASAASFSESYGSPTESWTYISDSGNKFGDGLGGSGSSYGATFTNGDVIGVALDMDAGTLVFYKNGTSQGTAFSSLSGKTVFPWLHLNTSGDSAILNTGSRAFAHTAPSGYKSLNTANLPTPTIEDGSQYFDIKLYTGNGTTGQSITGLDFSPDFVWIKERSSTGWHLVFDTVRGAPRALGTNSANSEYNIAETLTSFDSNGFSVDYDGASSSIVINRSGQTYAAWAWDAGSSNTTIAAGGLNSSVYNQSYAITSNITGNLPASGNPLANWFNGQRANKMEPSGSGSLDFTGVSGLQNFSGTLQFAVSAYQGSTSMKFVINASTDNLTFTTNTLPSSSGGFPSQLLTIPVTSLRTLDFTSVSGQSTQFWGMYLDGKLLVDSTATPDNVPSIASTVRANPSAGFSIVDYTGTGAAATIGHGLNAKPSIALIKPRSASGDWYFYTNIIDGSLDALILNATDAKGDSGWSQLLNSSSVLTMEGNSSVINASGTNYIAYCFAPVEGYLAMGSYQGNQDVSGPFVYTGFKVAMLWVKRTDVAADWFVWDKERGGANFLCQNASYIENVTANGARSFPVDILSNGFKIRTNGTNVNGPGTFAYIAFAENPFASNGGLAR